jgi:hypothetical protein
MIQSENDYDWLGHGYYFWEYNDQRALRFAEEYKGKVRKNKVTIETPAVLGAILDLGVCLDLLDSKNIEALKLAYEVLTAELGGTANLPTNYKEVDGKSTIRKLDCAVIETLHKMTLKVGKHFDSVRAMFPEGAELYPGAGFNAKNHIQLCIINPNCIKGYFIPREENTSWTPSQGA